jgi:hypothetical protein
MEEQELVFDEMMGRWVSPAEYEEFINLMLEETETQREIKDGIKSDLNYPEYNLKVIQDIAKGKNNRC